MLEYERQDDMNAYLDAVSNAIEGVVVGRSGHNFPKDEIMQRKHLLSKDIYTRLTNKTIANSYKYVIAFVSGDQITRRHEFLHAKYYLDLEYRQQATRLWSRLADRDRARIEKLFTEIGYNTDRFIDEFQAYYFEGGKSILGKLNLKKN